VSELALVFAFSAGLLATVNPCGFIMLPAFVSYQLGARDEQFAMRPLPARLVRAGLVAAVVTAGFLVVFAVVGLVFALGGRAVAQFVPWAALGIGLALIAVGLAGLRGHGLRLPLPSLAATKAGAGIGAMFLFGVGYAVASLSCTLPVFLVVIGSALAAGGLVGAFALFVAYALGMGAVLGAVALATALAKEIVVRWLLAATPHVERLGALLLIAAGAYLVYYQLSAGFLVPGGF